MKLLTAIFVATSILLSAKIFAAEEFIYRPAEIVPPTVPREFRGAWITEVASNADWPAKPGESVAEQKAELISLLDHAQQLHLNAIVFQIRPASDAVYSSSLEPWSEFLTGAQGKPPQPFYDPLAFAIEEAHKRGLELHAWFNPFRARLASAKSPPALNHVSQTHPEWIRQYGDQLWLDPGDPAVRAYVLRVVMDVVKRYDVDGVTFDDYFYPYPEKDAGDFPDYETWKKFGLPLHLSRDEWRRANINEFIYNTYQSIKAVKPWVKFGVSPFGIWRPGFPPQIRGLDAYGNLYADSRLWFASGWLDYFAPQLDWPTSAPQQSFPVLLNWWAQQNVKGRILAPKLNAAVVGEKFPAAEIARQIQFVRAQRGAGGEIFYHLKNLVDDGALNEIVREANPQPALMPPMPWLNPFSTPGKPVLSVEKNTSTNLTLHWELAAGNELPRWWLLQFCETNGVWTTQLYPAEQTGCAFAKLRPEIISVCAVDSFGNVSPAAAVKKILRSRQVLYLEK